jgi:hypothetical protein
LHVEQLQSEHVQLVHESFPQLAHWHCAWLQFSHAQSVHWQFAHESLQLLHEQMVHSS